MAAPKHIPVPLIFNGVFFQAGMGPVIGEDPKMGLMVYMVEVIRQTFFSGVFSFGDTDFKFNGVGQMTDRYGIAELTDVGQSDTEFTFTKRYLDRQDLIRYSFSKRGALWVGGFEGDMVGTGDANCIITETTIDFFANQQARTA